ncbi:MAG: dienelactone hydrolase family protein [Candidatus Velthaea sp.]
MIVTSNFVDLPAEQSPMRSRVAPESYHRIEPAGSFIPFAERERAMHAAKRTTAEEFDADARTTLDFLAGHPRVRAGALGATGFCIGAVDFFRQALGARG